MDLSLGGKTAIITGSSKGIGKGIAESLASEGCDVVICARHEEKLNKTAGELEKYGNRVVPVTADLTKESNIKKLVDESINVFGKVDILVNNAGAVGPPEAFDKVSTRDWRNVFELNLFAVVTLTRAIVPCMKEQGGGRIINISSENGQQPYPDMIPYSATKAALNNFTKSLSKLYAEDGILVNTVSPAFIQTPMVNDMVEAQAEEKGIAKDEAIRQFLENNRPHIELKRPGKIEEVGPVVAFLASDRASFINGANIRVDGGSVASV